MLKIGDYFVTAIQANWRLLLLHCWQYGSVEGTREFHDEFLGTLIKIGVLSTQREGNFEVVCPSSRLCQDNIKEENLGPMMHDGKNGERGPFFFTDEINAQRYLEVNFHETPYCNKMFVRRN